VYGADAITEIDGEHQGYHALNATILNLLKQNP